MKACELRGCWHWEFKGQSKQEQQKWMIYEEMIRRREIHFNDKHRAAMADAANKDK